MSSQVKPSLEWLLDPIREQTFFEQHWEKKPLVVKRGKKDYFASLLSLDEVDRALTTLNLTYPNITLKNADKNVTAADYTVRGSLDVAAVYRLFGEGSTIVLAFLDNVIPTLTSLCRGIENELCFPLQANVYLTPPGAKGAKHHYDTHDVFVVQVHGSKHWSIYGTPLELPLRSQDFDAVAHPRGDSTMEFDLEAGDVAYVPRGVVHEARSSDDVSLHVTLGILSNTWADLLLEFVAQAVLTDPAFRKTLPPGFAKEGFDRAKAKKTLSNLMQQLSAKPNLDEALDLFSDQWLAACPPILRGQMEQMALVDQISFDTVIGARRDIVSTVRTDGDSTAIYCFGKKISFPPHAMEAARFAMSQPKFVVRDLPGDLNEEAKLTLVRRLIKEGLVMVLHL